MSFRRFLVRYILDGEIVTRYANSVAELEELLAVPRGRGIGWKFKSVQTKIIIQYRSASGNRGAFLCDKERGFGPVFLRAWRKDSVRLEVRNGRFGEKLVCFAY